MVFFKGKRKRGQMKEHFIQICTEEPLNKKTAGVLGQICERYKLRFYSVPLFVLRCLSDDMVSDYITVNVKFCIVYI